jgi:hypothetical protein
VPPRQRDRVPAVCTPAPGKASGGAPGPGVERRGAMKHLHLIVPELWPPPTRDVARELPALSALLDRGRPRPVARHLSAALARSLGGAETIPIAPYTYALDGGEPGEHVWMRADPVCLVMHRDFLVVAPAPGFRLDADESRALAAALSRHFEADGLAFLAPHPRRWYLRLERQPDMGTLPPEVAAGRRVDAFLPRGQEAGTWLARLNEIQMLLHAHPVNEARELRGEPPVNSLWFWGAGRFVRLATGAWGRVVARHETALALGRAAGSEISAAEGLRDLPLQAGAVLAVLDTLQEAAVMQDAGLWRERARELEAGWFRPALRLLQTRRLGKLTLEVPGEPGRCLELGPPDAWRLWRRGSPD